MLIYLHEFGNNFQLQNSECCVPIGMISDKSVVTTIGVNLNFRNANGESLLDIKTKEFDKTMIGLGVNILEPNPDGSFWIQKALHNKYCKS